MKELLRLALQPSVVKRALKYAVVVGAVLIAINHADALIKGEITPGRLCKMALTVVVPYVVSTLSSVGAMRERHDICN
jgi:phosphotransacetylase